MRTSSLWDIIERSLIWHSTNIYVAIDELFIIHPLELTTVNSNLRTSFESQPPYLCVLIFLTNHQVAYIYAYDNTCIPLNINKK